MSKLTRMVKAASKGCFMPYQAMKASDETGVPFHILCALLEQETSGGRNIFGHDASIFKGAGRVTARKYAIYKKERDRFKQKRMQGVGPLQLTWWEFQDEADEAGGCHRPYYNILTGARILRRWKDQGLTWRQV